MLSPATDLIVASETEDFVGTASTHNDVTAGRPKNSLRSAGAHTGRHEFPTGGYIRGIRGNVGTLIDELSQLRE